MMRAQPHDTRPAVVRPLCCAAAAVLAVLAGCGSAPAVRYHTLFPAAATGAARVSPTIAWNVAGVSVPAQVDQPQWVVRLPDDSMRLLEQERWVAPLADEMQGAFGEAIARRLGGPGLTRPASGKRWRVRIDVHRFDSAPSQHAALVVDWSASSGGNAPELRCRDAVRQPVTADLMTLAAAHRQAVAQIGERIAAALQSLDAGAAVRCAGAD